MISLLYLLLLNASEYQYFTLIANSLQVFTVTCAGPEVRRCLVTVYSNEDIDPESSLFSHNVLYECNFGFSET